MDGAKAVAVVGAKNALADDGIAAVPDGEQGDGALAGESSPCC